MQGEIQSSWKKVNNKIIQRVSIPVNTTADIYFKADKNSILANGKPLTAFTDMQIKSENNGNVQIEAGSGTYEFIITKK